MHPASPATLVALLVWSAAGQISRVASGDTVFLKSHTGHHLDIESGVARARWNSRSVWQSLVIEKVGGGTVQHGDTIFLKTHLGLYLHVKHVDVQALWTERGIWQGFVVEKAGGGTINGIIYPGDPICLLAHTGHHIDVQGGVVQARWRECGAWQSFMLEVKSTAPTTTSTSTATTSTSTTNRGFLSSTSTRTSTITTTSTTSTTTTTITVTTTATTSACRTAVNGDPCFHAVLWAMSTGVKTHPEWYPGLTQWSSFEQFQQLLHEIRADNGVCPEPCRDDSALELVWEDNFDGHTVNTTNWIVGSLRDPVSGHLVPGSVGDHLLNWGYQGYITEEDTYLENGNLVLRNQKRSYKGSSPAGDFWFTSGHVMSMHRVFLNKGYVEFRAKFPTGAKLWPALWLVAEDLVWGPEWDMWEYFGWKDNRVGYDAMGMHLFESSPWPHIKIHDGWIKGYNSNYNCSAWHVYGWEWTDAAATWWIDGHLVYKLARSPSMHWPDKDMYLILNNGVKTNSPDADTAWPNYLTIDYVKVYKRKYRQDL